MLLLLCLLLSVLGEKFKEEDLVKGLENILGECTDIIGAVGNFIDSHLTPDEERRLEEGKKSDDSTLVGEVESKLKTCMSILEAVDEFNMKYRARMGQEEEDVGNEINGTLKDPIILNVGGEFFSTSLPTLRAKSGTYLEKMFRKGAATTCSADGSYFIDRNPSTFGYVLEYLRTEDMLVKSGDESVRMQALDDAEFFQLPEGLQIYLRWSSLRDGLDLSYGEFSFLNKELKAVSKEMGGLLYQASKDDDSSGNFHSRCDSKGATVVIIETTAGNMFGGFIDVPWTSSAGWSSSTKAFLFRLRPAMKRYYKKNGGNYAIYRHSSYGPIFGNGYDLIIYSNCMDYATSYTIGGNAYDVPTYELNGGEKYFRVKDYVVLQAESL